MPLQSCWQRATLPRRNNDGARWSLSASHLLNRCETLEGLVPITPFSNFELLGCRERKFLLTMILSFLTFNRSQQLFIIRATREFPKNQFVPFFGSSQINGLFARTTPPQKPRSCCPGQLLSIASLSDDGSCNATCIGVFDDDESSIAFKFLVTRFTSCVNIYKVVIRKLVCH